MSYLRETTLFFDSRKANGISQNFTTKFSPPFQLDQTKQYVIGLVSAEVWYSWYNVNKTNNLFKYNNNTTWKTITLPSGAYNVTDINNEIKRHIVINGDNADSIDITPNYNTLKTRIVLTNNYQIDFTITNGLNSVLGFDNRILTGNGTYDGEHNVNITEINSLLIKCSAVVDSYVNGSSSDVIYNFTPDVPAGSLITIRPFQIMYLPINHSHSIPEISMKITDQSGNEVDLNNERVTYYLHLKQII
jgi:hypothetical protein